MRAKTLKKCKKYLLKAIARAIAHGQHSVTIETSWMTLGILRVLIDKLPPGTVITEYPRNIKLTWPRPPPPFHCPPPNHNFGLLSERVTIYNGKK